jgi:hypothetical protein
MAYGNNTNAPTGFRPYSYKNGTLWTGGEQTFDLASAYSTSLFEGDPVTILADGTIGIATAGAGALGVFQGVTYINSAGEPVFTNWWPANTVTQSSVAAQAKVVVDENVLYDIQVSTDTGTPGPVNPVALAQADVGQNANFSVTVNSFNPTVAPNAVSYAANPATGNTMTGISGYYLDYGSLGTGATLSLKIWGLTPKPGNVSSAGGTTSGTLNFNNALVLFNNHILKGGTGTAGV